MLCIEVRITISRLFLSIIVLKLFILRSYSTFENGSLTFSPFFNVKKSGLSIRLIQADISFVPSHYQTVISQRNK